MEKCGFARTVGPDNRNPATGFDMPAKTLKENLRAEVLVDLDELDQGALRKPADEAGDLGGTNLIFWLEVPLFFREGVSHKG